MSLGSSRFAPNLGQFVGGLVARSVAVIVGAGIRLIRERS